MKNFANVNQHDNVRALPRCPNCRELKPIGNLLCWPCHHSQKEHNDGDYSPRLKRKLDALDASLAGAKQ